MELTFLVTTYADYVRDAGGAKKNMDTRRSYRTYDTAKLVYQMYCKEAAKAARLLSGHYKKYGDLISAAVWEEECTRWRALGRFRGKDEVAEEVQS